MCTKRFGLSLTVWKIATYDVMINFTRLSPFLSIFRSWVGRVWNKATDNAYLHVPKSLYTVCTNALMG